MARKARRPTRHDDRSSNPQQQPTSARPTATTPTVRVARRSRRTTILSVGLALGIVIVGGWFFFGANRVPTTGVSQTTQAGDLHVTMQLDDTVLGARVINLLVKDASGQMVDVNTARLRFAMTDMDMGKS